MLHFSHLGEFSQNFERKQLETERKGQIGETEVSSSLLAQATGRALADRSQAVAEATALPPASMSPARGFSLSLSLFLRVILSPRSAAVLGLTVQNVLGKEVQAAL